MSNAITVLHDARLWDGLAEDAVEGAAVVIEGARIREAGPGVIYAGDATRIDCAGHFLMPGLIDAHYHANTPSYDFYGTDRMHPALLASHAVRLLTGAVDRGYTTIRDAGGGDVGLAQALDAGVVDGPRFFYPGKALTQTGGHGDMRRRGEPDLCGCGEYAGVICGAPPMAQTRCARPCGSDSARARRRSRFSCRAAYRRNSPPWRCPISPMPKSASP